MSPNYQVYSDTDVLLTKAFAGSFCLESASCEAKTWGFGRFLRVASVLVVHSCKILHVLWQEHHGKAVREKPMVKQFDP